MNPFPMNCTVEPAAPVVGAKVSVGAVIAKYAVAVFPAVSVTTIVLFAVAVTGTTKAATVTVPVAPVVPAAADMRAPLKVTLNAVVATPKPVPAIAIEDPLSPEVGVSTIEPATMSVVVALLVPSLTSTV